MRTHEGAEVDALTDHHPKQVASGLPASWRFHRRPALDHPRTPQ